MKTPTRSTSRIPALALTLALVALAPAGAFACDCGKPAKPDARPSATLSPSPANASSNDAKPAGKPATKKHPLKGVVTDILPSESALMVKHEEIPGFMKAMTMMLTVDPAVLSTVKKGDAITGLIYRDAEGTWRLDDVKVVQPAS